MDDEPISPLLYLGILIFCTGSIFSLAWLAWLIATRT
jgi:hypothetical protein